MLRRDPGLEKVSGMVPLLLFIESSSHGNHLGVTVLRSDQAIVGRNVSVEFDKVATFIGKVESLR